MSQRLDVGTELIDFGLHTREQKPRDEDGELITSSLNEIIVLEGKQ